MTQTTQDLLKHDDGTRRCWWCGDDPLYTQYHDTEWGHAITDDNHLFEKLALEGFQCGLAWITVLRKRENFRHAFDHFEIDRVAKYGPRQVARLLQNAGIIRHRGKIEAAIQNASQARRLVDEFGSLSAYFMDITGRNKPPRRRAPRTRSDLPAVTDLSTLISRDLRKRGWRYVGPTTIYAFMQSVGIVNDHLVGCHARRAAEASRTEAGFPA